MFLGQLRTKLKRQLFARIKALKNEVKTVAIIKFHSPSYCLGMPAQIKTEQRENTQYKTFQEYLIDPKHKTQRKMNE